MQQKVISEQLIFKNPDHIAPGLNQFWDSKPGIIEVISVLNFQLAREVPGSSFTNPGQPVIEYEFRYIITYLTEIE